MTKSFRKYLLSELRMAVYQPGDPAELTDELLCEAVTLNENLQILGYILRPEDLLRLAVSPSLRGFYTGLKALVPDVTAQPGAPPPSDAPLLLHVRARRSAGDEDEARLAARL